MTPPYRIHLAVPDLGGREVYSVNQALLHRQLTQGAFVERFEAEFAAKLGVQHAVACASGTAALHLALLAAGVKPGDRVLVPTLTYVASVAAIRYCGAIPVFQDVDPKTWGLRGNGASAQAIIPVHLYGVPCQPGVVAGVACVDDCAESLGATHDWVRSRRDPWLATYSFYGNKILTTGEGGMVVTDDASLAAKLRLFRGQGQSPDRRYWHTVVGMNYRMMELSAAIGLAQLERLDEMLKVRHQRLTEYHNLLRGTGVEWQTPRPGTVQAPWVAACLLPKQPIGTNLAQAHRDITMQKLATLGIESRPVFPLVSDMPPYREFAKDQDVPVAREISSRGIVLPLHSQMRAEDVEEVCASLRRLL